MQTEELESKSGLGKGVLNLSINKKRSTGLTRQYHLTYLYIYIFTIALGGFYVGSSLFNIRL